jgi:protocatechuate 3,4-dioxygenase alpha subunit
VRSLTPSQTIGPFFGILIPRRDTLVLAAEGTPGRITVQGTVRDGAGEPVSDALIEVWQADAEGRWSHPDDPRDPGPDGSFSGFGRIHVGVDGGFTVETIRPGSVPGPNGAPQAPHLVVGLFARGLLTRLVTRVYFDDEPSNATDTILTRLPTDRRSTLIAVRGAEGRYRFDIALQGPCETVFFDV